VSRWSRTATRFLLSKELVTIDSHVPLELDLSAMETQTPDLEACRELFTELEFTSMLRDLAPSETAPVVQLIDEPTKKQAAAFYAVARSMGFRLRARFGRARGAGE